ncbi:MAG: macrocin O-methyltransferase [Proteobacteria bacterium]|nr:macrocin O-methyltransferase [Pseudomonadota bacterium]
MHYILLDMARALRKWINRSLSRYNLRISSIALPVEFSKQDREIFDYIIKHDLSMASRERIIATILACKFVIENNIEGDFVECGVWKGGHAIAAKLMFEAYGSAKNVVLYDTFTGMTAPTEFDKKAGNNESALPNFKRMQRTDHNIWCYTSLENVKQNFTNARADLSGVRFIAGDVTKTLTAAANLPNKIAVLRLDTDWYESTKIEMEVLYPLLSKGGVLIIDDYGTWIGARKAVDEYFTTRIGSERPFLQYTDFSGRMGIKP